MSCCPNFPSYEIRTLSHRIPVRMNICEQLRKVSNTLYTKELEWRENGKQERKDPAGLGVKRRPASPTQSVSTGRGRVLPWIPPQAETAGSFQILQCDCLSSRRDL